MSSLLKPSQKAMFAGLVSVVPGTLATVRQAVLQNTPPPLVIIGNMDSVPAEKAHGSRLITIEVQSVYRGQDRGVLLDIVDAVELLDGDPIGATDPAVAFSTAMWVRSTISDVAADGVTYAAISVFEFYAQPV